MVGWLEGNPVHRKSCLTDPRGSFSEQVEDVDLRGNQLSQVNLEKELLNGSSKQ